MSARVRVRACVRSRKFKKKTRLKKTQSSFSRTSLPLKLSSRFSPLFRPPTPLDPESLHPALYFAGRYRDASLALEEEGRVLHWHPDGGTDGRRRGGVPTHSPSRLVNSCCLLRSLRCRQMLGLHGQLAQTGGPCH